MWSNFIYFWIMSGVIAIAGFLFIRFNKNARLKRVVFPLMLILTYALVIYYVWNTFGDEFGSIIYVFAAIAAGISYLKYRVVVFCDACSAMTNSERTFSRPTECSKCGSKWV